MILHCILPPPPLHCHPGQTKDKTVATVHTLTIIFYFVRESNPFRVRCLGAVPLFAVHMGTERRGAPTMSVSTRHLLDGPTTCAQTKGQSHGPMILLWKPAPTGRFNGFHNPLETVNIMGSVGSSWGSKACGLRNGTRFGSHFGSKQTPRAIPPEKINNN